MRASEGRMMTTTMTTTTTVTTMCVELREGSLGMEGVYEAVTVLWKVDEGLVKIRHAREGKGELELEDRAKIAAPTTDNGDDNNA